LSDQEKDLEILVLRHQLDILERKHKKPIRPTRVEKLTLAVLTHRLKRMTNRTTNQLLGIIRIFQPETVLRWHRELVRRKWTRTLKHKRGRPRISQEIEDLIVRLAQENVRWGYGKIEGELFRLDITVSQTSIRNILNKNGIVPVISCFRSSSETRSIGWHHQQLLSCPIWFLILLALTILKIECTYLNPVGHQDYFWLDLNLFTTAFLTI
jgi:hypothetical protein